MTEGGFFETGRRISPTGLTIVILLHGAALTALALSKMEVIGPVKIPRTEIFEVIEPPEPAPIPEPAEKPDVQPKSQVDYVKPIVPPMPSPTSDLVMQPGDNVVIHDPGPIGAEPLPPRPTEPVQPAPPVRVAAQMRGNDLQPPYPPALEAAQTEGTVAVRITIGADGRVKSVEKVSASHDAFFRATERHALRAWRFRPATVDGRPVESRQVINVDFRLNG